MTHRACLNGWSPILTFQTQPLITPPHVEPVGHRNPSPLRERLDAPHNSEESPQLYGGVIPWHTAIPPLLPPSHSGTYVPFLYNYSLPLIGEIDLLEIRDPNASLYPFLPMPLQDPSFFRRYHSGLPIENTAELFGMQREALMNTYSFPCLPPHFSSASLPLPAASLPSYKRESPKDMATAPSRLSFPNPYEMPSPIFTEAPGLPSPLADLAHLTSAHDLEPSPIETFLPSSASKKRQDHPHSTSGLQREEKKSKKLEVLALVASTFSPKIAPIPFKLKLLSQAPKWNPVLASKEDAQAFVAFIQQYVEKAKQIKMEKLGKSYTEPKQIKWEVTDPSNGNTLILHNMILEHPPFVSTSLNVLMQFYKTLIASGQNETFLYNIKTHYSKLKCHFIEWL